MSSDVFCPRCKNAMKGSHEGLCQACIDEINEKSARRSKVISYTSTFFVVVGIIILHLMGKLTPVYDIIGEISGEIKNYM